MIVCPQCKHEELRGTIFCTECGMQLVQSSRDATQTISRSRMGSDRLTHPVQPSTLEVPRGRLAVHLLESGILIPLEDRDEFTFGRLSVGQPVMPDVDLSAYKAYECGVSRLHAVVRLRNEQLTITDLGSANGSYVNGARLLPNSEQRITSGDLIALGKLKFQLVFTPQQASGAAPSSS